MPEVTSLFRLPLGQAARTISRRLQRAYQQHKHIIVPMLLAPIGMGLSIPSDGGARPGQESHSLKARATDPKGIHGHPSTILSQTAAQFASEITIANQAGEKVDLKNSLMILSLCLTRGSRFSIEAKGEDAAQAVTALARVLAEELKVASVWSVSTDVQVKLKGMAVTDAVVIGRALPIKEVLDIESYPRIDIRAEAERQGKSVEDLLRNRLGLVVDAFRAIEEELVGDESDVAQTLSVLLMEIKTKVLEHMEKNTLCARDAVEALLNDYKVLRVSDNEKMQSIYTDIYQMCTKMLSIKHRRVVDIRREIERLGRDDVVIVADHISPADVGLVNDARVAGIVRENGSREDHLSLRLGDRQKAGLVNARDAVAAVRLGSQIIVDGMTGRLIVNPGTSTLRKYRILKKRSDAVMASLVALRESPAVTRNGARIRLMGNAANPEEVALLLEHGLEGVGLVRTEFFFIYDREGLTRKAEPSVVEQTRYYTELIRAAGDKEITFRTIDPDLDKSFPYFSRLNGDLVAGGKKGLALCLDREGHGPYYYAFRNQLKALLLTNGRIKVMFPLVRSNEEFLFAMEVVDSVRAELESQGIKVNDRISYGIMVEHPAVLRHLDELAADERLDFFSLGTNDLTQYLTGTNRYSSVTSQYFDELDPRVIRAIDQTVKAAARADIQLSLCGNMGNEGRKLLVLLGLGVRSISFSSRFADLARQLISSVDSDSLRLMVRNIAGITTGSEVRRYIDEFILEQERAGAWADLSVYEDLLFD
ncbi:MAG: HPr family phosphocarrier protein [Candidatus Saganbacteria bacterium]|nr:HPr family phosphocarrier protein [Candidatus Saganbacteria bacterium]